MTTVYFDVTDVVHFASRYNRVTGIQRVQLNIVTLLARKYGGQKILCTLFDDARQSMTTFDPALLSANEEFDAERFLAEIGMGYAPSRIPSKAQVKSYLRRYHHRKLLRAFKKIDVYLSAVFMPQRLVAQGFSHSTRTIAKPSVVLQEISVLPDNSSYVCMGSVWLHPAVLAFGKRHRERGQDVVQMVYDLIPIVHPEYYSKNEVQAYTDWLRDAFSYVSRFICISQWTAADLRKFALSVGQHPAMRAIPLAHEFFGFDRESKVQPTPDLINLSEVPYVLCVGTIESRKNGIALLRAWQRLMPELGARMPLLVFAGKYGKGGEQVQQLLVKDPELARQVRLIHSPSDRELAWLYQNCLCTVFPSTYEGWGLPVGESVWFGKYCVASNATSIPEVCGELLEYIDVRDAESFLVGLRKAIVDTDYLRQREALIGAAEVRRWVDVAQDIYRMLQGQHN